jgi:hypothetical protein
MLDAKGGGKREKEEERESERETQLIHLTRGKDPLFLLCFSWFAIGVGFMLPVF